MNREISTEMTRNGDELLVVVAGRLDVINARIFEEKLRPELDSTQKLIFDLAGLNYISSAGLRVIMTAYQELSEHEPEGEMIMKNVNKAVREVFELTDLVDIFKIE